MWMRLLTTLLVPMDLSKMDLSRVDLSRVPLELRKAGQATIEAGQATLSRVAEMQKAGHATIERAVEERRSRRVGTVDLPVMEADEARRVDKEMNAQEGWSLVSERSGIKVWAKADSQRATGGGKFVCIRAEGTLDAPAPVVLELFRSTDESLIRSFNPMFDSGHDLEPLARKGNSKVSWACSKAVFPLKARDFVTRVRYVASPGDGIAIISEGLSSHPDAPRGYVRARVVTGLQVITPLGDKRCRFTTVSRVDPGGAMPAWLSNTIAKRDAPNYLLRLEKAAQLKVARLAHRRPEPGFSWHRPVADGHKPAVLEVAT